MSAEQKEVTRLPWISMMVSILSFLVATWSVHTTWQIHEDNKQWREQQAEKQEHPQLVMLGQKRENGIDKVVFRNTSSAYPVWIRAVKFLAYPIDRDKLTAEQKGNLKAFEQHHGTSIHEWIELKDYEAKVEPSGLLEIPLLLKNGGPEGFTCMGEVYIGYAGKEWFRRDGFCLHVAADNGRPAPFPVLPNLGLREILNHP
jgi:hypothetical protein